jgi:glutathione S-transferase
MKLYMHPVSMTSRPVRLFIAENNIPVEEEVVDLMTGAHLKPPFSTINPNKMVPFLVDGSLELSESSAILKYLADKVNSPTYPKELQQRAKVNEAMDWFNTNFYRDFGYGLCYPQLFPHHKRPTEAAQSATVQWGLDRSRTWLQTLNDTWLAKGPYVSGNSITIADYLGSCLVTLGEVTRTDFSKFQNVNAWIGRMKTLKSWGKVNEALYGYAQYVKDQPFVTA